MFRHETAGPTTATPRPGFATKVKWFLIGAFVASLLMVGITYALAQWKALQSPVPVLEVRP